MKPFRFGLNIRDASSRAEWQDKARKVEALGYAVLLVPDHLAAMLATIPAVMSAADATTRLRIGTNVLNNDLRHPVLLAREAATMDLLTDGRLELGLGAGYMRIEYDQAGLRFDRGGIRVERLAESVPIIKDLLGGAEVTFVGQHYRVTSHKIYPLPVQRPRPPIIIGGNGPRLLALAAREADTVNLTGVTFTQGGTTLDMSGWKVAGVDERLRVIRDAAGDRFGALELSAQIQRVIVTDRPREAAEELQKTWKQISVDEILAAPFVLIGTVDEMVEALRARRDRWGISYFVTFEPFLDALAPVVARLSGK
ncbi:MAG TPA: LLM class F420-dependent oxidoreductase [Methylomirabilota bacterium]|jgi:probable F420-dependent oxidoreductase|nr:LLM class F420-dependent oxidoreductase [Methylomirabilota bacterium]